MALTYSKLSDTQYSQTRYDAISYIAQTWGQVLYFNMFAFVLLTIGLLAYILRNPIE